jgi:hypothetical protein
MKTLTAAAAILAAAASPACGSTQPGPAGPAHADSSVALVIFTPVPGQPVPSVLIVVDSRRMSVSLRNGYACFSAGGTPVEWPAGYSARLGPGGQVEVRDREGHVVAGAGVAYHLGAANVPSTGSTCSRAGTSVFAILSTPAPKPAGQPFPDPHV